MIGKMHQYLDVFIINLGKIQKFGELVIQLFSDNL